MAKPPFFLKCEMEGYSASSSHKRFILKDKSNFYEIKETNVVYVQMKSRSNSCFEVEHVVSFECVLSVALQKYI